jgi:hypothetical protein
MKERCKCCGIPFEKKVKYMEFCEHSCRDRFYRLLHCKEYFKLDVDDRKLRLKLLEKYGGDKIGEKNS